MQTVLLTLSVRRSPSSVTLTTPESSSAYSEAQPEVAQTGLADTFRRSLTFEPKETVACNAGGCGGSWEIQHRRVSIPKAFEFRHELHAKFTARVCVVGDTRSVT